MKKFKPYLLIFLGVLALFTTGAALLTYTGPGDRSAILGNVIKVLECGSTQYEGGPVVWRYRDWLGLSAPQGSAQALTWMAAYEDVDDPATPICTRGREGIWVWQLSQTTVSFPAATFSADWTCSASQGGWCRAGYFDFGATEPIPGKRITSIESAPYGTLCSVNAASGNCQWTPPDGVHSANFWAISSYGDTSLLESKSWKLDSLPPTLSITVPAADGSGGWFRTPPMVSLSASDATSGLSSMAFSTGGTSQVVTKDGANTLSATATDNAGNKTTKSAVVKVDQTDPSVLFSKSGTLGDEGWYRSIARVTLDISDAASGIGSSQYSVNGGAYTAGGDGVVLPFSDGTHSVSVRAWDVAGNSITASTGVQVDTLPPALFVSAPTPDGQNDWFVTSPTLSLTASDATSGLASALFDNGLSTMTINGDGIFNVTATARDNAGNITPYSASVKKDSTTPNLTIPSSPDGLNGWYVSLPTLSLAASDATSGILSAVFSDGNTSHVITSQGTSTVSAHASDYAGNTTSATAMISVDTVPPTLSVSSPEVDGLNGWYITSPTFSLTASDATSGLASALFSNGKASLTIDTDGVHNLSALASDKAGNTAPEAITVKRDATPPSLSIPSIPDGLNGWYVSLPTISLIASDATSGLASAIFGNGKTTTNITDDGVYNLNAIATDNAGNTSSTAKTIQVDTVPPALYIPSNPDGLNGWYVTVPTLSLLASDATSGLDNSAFSNGQPTMLINSDGVFNIKASATDKAGNISSTLKTIQVDTTAPELSFSIPYAPDGQNGWYVTKPTLTVTAADATSGLASAIFDDGGSTFIARDGMQVVSATARDRAGNAHTISQTLKVDTTPPTLTPSISGPGAHGWYNTGATISLNTLDTISGIGQSEYRLDGGSWHSGSGLSVSTEGEHSVEMRVTDNAGNTTTASRSFKLDTTKPVSAFTNPPEGTQVKAAGSVSFTGKSADALSGLASTEISLDGGTTWLPLSSTAGAWSYSWDTTQVPDGLYTILVHADDRAGNRENTARVQVLVGNKPPKVEIQSSWWLWEAGYIKIQPRQIPLREVMMRITCAPFHPDVVMTYTGENFPTNLKWDRLCGNGAYAAESGDYAVTLTACDTLGHCAKDSGLIKVPFIAPPVPTWTPTAEPSPTQVSTTHPSPTVQVRITSVPTLTLAPTPVPVAPQPRLNWLSWTLAYFLAGLFALAFAAIFDPRPGALRKLGNTLAKLSQD